VCVCVCVAWIRTARDVADTSYALDVVCGPAIFSSCYSPLAVKLLYSVSVILQTIQSCGLTV